MLRTKEYSERSRTEVFANVDIDPLGRTWVTTGQRNVEQNFERKG